MTTGEIGASAIKLVARAHALGVKILPYVANDTEAVAHPKTTGVDGIFSDYPDRL